MQKIRSLIVSGHVSFRQALKTYLEEMDEVEAVETASDGHEAVNLIESFKPHLLIADGSLETFDCLMESLRGRGHTPLEKTIVYTLHACEIFCMGKGIAADESLRQDDLFERIPLVIAELTAKFGRDDKREN